jgi:hypothetical protein
MTTFVIEPGALVAILPLTIRGTVVEMIADCPGYWKVTATDATMHVFPESQLVPPDSITTEEEREARRQEQIQRKTDLAAEWTSDLATRGFTTVRGMMRLRFEQPEAGRSTPPPRPEAIIEAVNAQDPEADWRTFMQALRSVL